MRGMGSGKNDRALSPWLAKYPVLKTVTNNQRQRHVHDRESWIAETDGARAFPWRVFIMTDRGEQIIRQTARQLGDHIGGTRRD